MKWGRDAREECANCIAKFNGGVKPTPTMVCSGGSCSLEVKAPGDTDVPTFPIRDAGPSDSQQPVSAVGAHGSYAAAMTRDSDGNHANVNPYLVGANAPRQYQAPNQDSALAAAFAAAAQRKESPPPPPPTPPPPPPPTPPPPESMFGPDTVDWTTHAYRIDGRGRHQLRPLDPEYCEALFQDPRSVFHRMWAAEPWGKMDKSEVIISDECEPSACLERNGFDGDCCAAPGEGSCQEGYKYEVGPECWHGVAYKTCCKKRQRRGAAACWDVSRQRSRDGTFHWQPPNKYFSEALRGQYCHSNWWEGAAKEFSEANQPFGPSFRFGPAPALFGFDEGIDMLCGGDHSKSHANRCYLSNKNSESVRSRIMPPCPVMLPSTPAVACPVPPAAPPHAASSCSVLHCSALAIPSSPDSPADGRACVRSLAAWL